MNWLDHINSPRHLSALGKDTKVERASYEDVKRRLDRLAQTLAANRPPTRPCKRCLCLLVNVRQVSPDSELGFMLDGCWHANDSPVAFDFCVMGDFIVGGTVDADRSVVCSARGTRRAGAGGRGLCGSTQKGAQEAVDPAQSAGCDGIARPPCGRRERYRGHDGLWRLWIYQTLNRRQSIGPTLSWRDTMGLGAGN
ncbi:hypothetical protein CAUPRSCDRAFT_12525 [Caulochytrium protostelioides]|uniref:Uncharacterized protein n=1 Tax=Caulochytrium protostelioides TaxID=1555241 RepID=A0A4P9WWZ4_9FUNG|nr:hypothetical protein CAUPRSCDRAFT_12525 [Caulochytrium protostelioides]